METGGLILDNPDKLTQKRAFRPQDSKHQDSIRGLMYFDYTKCLLTGLKA